MVADQQNIGPGQTSYNTTDLPRWGYRPPVLVGTLLVIPPVRVSHGHLQVISDAPLGLVVSTMLMPCTNCVVGGTLAPALPNTPRRCQRTGKISRSRHHA